MKKAELEAKIRSKLGKSVKSLRTKGILPAVVYGAGIESQALEVDKVHFEKLVSGEHGTNVIITLKIMGDKKAKSLPVITHDIQKDPLTDSIIHVDFFRIKLDEKIKAKIPVELIGEPIGVKEDGGILISGLKEVEVKCLPTEIPDKFEFDVSKFRIGDALHVSDIKAVKGIEVLTVETEMLANVAPPTKIEEVVAPPPLPEGAVPPEEIPVEEGAPPAPAAPPPEEKGKAEKAKGEKAPAPPPAKEEKKK